LVISISLLNSTFWLNSPLFFAAQQHFFAHKHFFAQQQISWAGSTARPSKLNSYDFLIQFVLVLATTLLTK
jgi:hypothetical protein